MKVNMNLGSKQNEETFNDYFGEDLLYGNISTLSEWVCVQKLPVHHKPLIAIKINHNKQAFKLSEHANDLSQLFDTLPNELNSIYSDYVEFNFSQKLKGMLTITVDWPHYLANLDQMNADNSSFTDSLLKIKQFRNALNNLANEITPETKDSLTKQDVVDQTSDFDDSTKQSEDDNMKELTQIAHANETSNSLPETEWGQDANDLSNSDESNDSEMPDRAQTTDNSPVKPEDDNTEDDNSTASDDANYETFDSTQTSTEPETADKETADNNSDTTGNDSDESGETSESGESGESGKSGKSGETSESANSDTNSSENGENDDPIEDDKTETSDDHAKLVNNETSDSENEESSDNDSENPENRYVKLSSEKFDHMIELLDNLVTSKTETKPDTDKDTDNSTNNETPVNSTGTPSDNNDASDETANNKSTEDDTDDKPDDSDSNQDDSEAERDDQAMANLIGNLGF